MPIIETAAGPLFYAQHGSAGLPVVAITGAGGTHRHWGYQMRDLAGIARLYTLDLPGHGRSPLPGRASVPEYGAAVLALLDACQLERAVLVGHSMGGAIALWAALERPERVAGLALVGSGARLRVAPAILQGLAADYLATQRMIVRMSYAPGTPAELLAQADADYARCDPQVYRDDFAACNDFDLRTRLGELSHPTAIVCGDADQMTPPKYSRELQAGIMGAALTMVARAGHMAMIERPAAVSAALRELVGRSGQ